jgi:iron complex transport system ATP-binding protein
MRIEARGIAVRADGMAILRGIDLTLEAGHLVGLIGPNGAGKTTLLRILANLQPPDCGSLLYDGATTLQIGRTAFARQLAYLAQGTVVHWPLTVERLVGLGRLPYRRFWSQGARDDEQAITEALRATETEPFRHRLFATLSGGERTRVLLARALAVKAQVLLADEPIAVLDPYHQLHVMELLQETAHQGKTVVVALHDLALAARFCARLVLLDVGRVVADGSPEVVLSAANLARVYRVAMLHGTHDRELYVLPWRRQPEAEARATVPPQRASPQS